MKTIQSAFKKCRSTFNVTKFILKTFYKVLSDYELYFSKTISPYLNSANIDLQMRIGIKINYKCLIENFVNKKFEIKMGL